MTTRAGAGWQVHHGESLAVMRSMAPTSIDGVVTDPPYSSGGAFRGDRVVGTEAKYSQTDYAGNHDEFAGDCRDAKAYMLWTSIWVSEAMRVCKPGAPIVVFSDWRQLSATIDSIQAGGAVFRGVFVWDKTPGCRPALGRPRNQCEFGVWGSFGPMPMVGPALLGCVTQSVGEKYHRTGKPVRVMRELVQMVPAGGVVLDPFCGSASTGVAALAEGRRFVGVEYVASIWEVACERLSGAIGAAPGQATLFDMGGMA